MSDRKQFIIVMLVAAIFVGWLGWRGFEVISLNQALKADEMVANYPYQHRVLRVEGGTAIMSSLRAPMKPRRTKHSPPFFRACVTWETMIVTGNGPSVNWPRSRPRQATSSSARLALIGCDGNWTKTGITSPA